MCHCYVQGEWPQLIANIYNLTICYQWHMDITGCANEHQCSLVVYNRIYMPTVIA